MAAPPARSARGGEGFPISPREWVRRFREHYDYSAESPLTDLGLFYERHRRFAEFDTVSDPSRPEYTDEEWDRAMTAFLFSLAREFGLIPATDPAGRFDVNWFWPGADTSVAVTIRPANNATDAILQRDLPEVVRTGAGLSVLILYPDYPNPPGTSGIDGAVREWQQRLARTLGSLRPARPFAILMISAYAWDVPAPWQAFIWDPRSARLEPAE
jgi:hypothetical protein